MSIKETQRQQFRDQGLFDAGKYGGNNELVECKDGKAGEYACKNVNMHGFLSHEETGSEAREGNDVWGMFYYFQNPFQAFH